MRTWFTTAVTLAALSSALIPTARADDGLVVFVGAANDSRWQRLIERNGLPDAPDGQRMTVSAVDEDFIQPFREALVLAASEPATKAEEACRASTLSLPQLVLSAREEMDVREWQSAIDLLDQAKATWHCTGIPAPLSEISEVYFLQGVASYLMGRSQGANPYFAAAFATGFEPPGVTAWPPDVREAYYNTAIDATLVPRVPLSVDKEPLDGMKVWIDGKEASEVYEVPVGEHVVQLTSASGRVVASALVNVDPNVGGGLQLPGDIFQVARRLDTLRALETGLAEDRLSFSYQRALSRFAEAEGYRWVVVSAVDSAAGDLASWTARPASEGSYTRAHLRGAGLGEVGSYAYPVLTGALIVGALSGGAGYGLAYQHLSNDLYPSQDAMVANQTRGYVAGGIGVGCAVGAAVVGTLWGIDKRRRRHDLIYGQRWDLGVEPLAGGAMLSLGGAW